MEAIEKLSRSGTTCLLTLPRSDLDAASTIASSKNTHSQSNRDDSLLLVQLPPGWCASDLKNAKFVVPASSSSDQERAQAALVSENKAASFHVQRVETSNCLIMVPPPPSTLVTATSPEASPERTSSTKRAKTIRPVSSRLLKRGGHGASFLELRQKTLSKCAIEQLFQAHKQIFNPLHHEDHTNAGADESDSGCAAIQGITIESVAAELQVSEAQVLQAISPELNKPSPIASACYYPMPGTSPTAYIILSEEAYSEAYQAILAALAETVELADYARGVDRNALIQSAVEKFSMYSTGNSKRGGGIHCLPGGVRGLVSFCVDRLTAPADDNGDYYTKGNWIRVDVARVAVIVACQLFQRQTAPWEESLFMARWQAELPGVGEGYQVDSAMLQGVAISTVGNDGDNQTYWKYLPPDALPLDAASGFASLFAFKERWLPEELQPYLDRWSDAAASGQADLLLQLTKTVTEERTGIPTKLITSMT